jgi:glycosyltransferase involved in cell wall biosynthesis
MSLALSVIIPAFNEEANITRAIRQVLVEPWTESLKLEAIIVVDDCSADGTQAIAESLARQDGRVRVLRNAQRSGKNAGIRAAAAVCQSDIIAVIDADVYFAPGCLVKTLQPLVEDSWLMASSCLIEPLPPRSWRERASASQALLVAELKRAGYAYLSALYALRAPAFGALDLPDNVADDAYVTLWLRAHGHRYAVCSNATAYIRAATGLGDFARQTLRGRYGEKATTHAVSDKALALDRRRALKGALARACIRDPLGFVLYAVWYGIVMATPVKLWLPVLSLSTFATVRSTKDVGTR